MGNEHGRRRGYQQVVDHVSFLVATYDVDHHFPMARFRESDQAAIEQLVASLISCRLASYDLTVFMLKSDEYPGVQYRGVSIRLLKQNAEVRGSWSERHLRREQRDGKPR